MSSNIRYLPGPRDLYVVIGDLLGVIPKSEKEVRYELEKIRNRLAFTAPELLIMRWGQVQDVLQTLGDPSKGPKWMRDVAKIFVGK